MSPPEPSRSLAVSSRALEHPARTLDDAVRLCDPFTPLHPKEDEDLRQDLQNVRGGDRLALVARSIRRAGGVPTLHLLSGHLGSGKTTELLRMQRRLASAEGGGSPVATLFLDADHMLDRTSVDLEDILLALWSLVYEQHPAAAAKVLVPLWKKQIGDSLGTVVKNLPSGIPQAIQKALDYIRVQGVEQKQVVRASLASVVPALIEGLNQAFQTIRETPPFDTSEPLVVLIDNLEKLSEGQRAGVERLYLDRLVALKGLDAHLVLTVPLYLCYAAAGAGLIGLYGGKVVVLPMIEVGKRVAEGGGDNLLGLRAMVELLQRRVRFDLLFEEGDQAALRIARASGGCIRHALRIVLDAVNEHDDPPVTAASVNRSMAGVQADFERALPEPYVPVLKHVAHTNRFPDDCKEDVKRDLLRHLFVLEYQNGDPEPWWAVHPLVVTCRKFREHP
ncbi:hypothetical protein [Polyangium mundeleinium]|uniref:Orc1-like AAA ATPase domain-containing protein n=1 Tax=Polyangium mundeleinium TaxID=2995306 RepID=A0ABT5EQK3_9BACT|nr:hypothetical protein [Polyangium mundeleinium]MDC0744103.1 hypothetical protein [Polyangium mundeleinium]